MKNIATLSVLFWLFSCSLVMGQETSATPKVEARLQEMKEVQAKVDKAEKAAKKVERAQKKAEKEAKQRKQLKDDIRDKTRAIDKDQDRVSKFKEKLDGDGAKGKLSPNDIEALNEKISKLEARIVKNQAYLKKLEKK